MPSRRHLARIAVMQTLFELQVREADATPILERNIKELEGDGDVDADFAAKLLAGARAHEVQVRSAIESCAPEWPLERMDRISRCILILGGYELLLGNDAPPPVVMNEAIEIAKQFGTEESGKFVNGVLNALAHRKAPG